MFLGSPSTRETRDSVGTGGANAESLTQQLDHCLVEGSSPAALLFIEGVREFIGHIPDRQVLRDILRAFTACIL